MEEKLKSYNDIKAKIKELKWEIKILENEEVQAAGPVLDVTGVKGTGFKSSPVELKAIKNTDKINSYKRQIEELEAELEYIDSKIKTLKDLEQKIVIDYYINKRTALAIASYTYREEKTIYKILKRAIDKMTLK